MARNSKRHVHKYHRVNIGHSNVWACALPDCTHYMPNNLASLVIGKSSLCWQCNNALTMSEATMQIDRPICPNCKLGIIDEVDEAPLSKALLDRLNRSE